MENKKLDIPIEGEYYLSVDSLIPSLDSCFTERIYQVVPFNEFKNNNSSFNKSMFTYWENISNTRSHLYAKETDYFVLTSSCSFYPNNVYVRTPEGDWRLLTDKDTRKLDINGKFVASLIDTLDSKELKDIVKQSLFNYWEDEDE